MAVAFVWADACAQQTQGSIRFVVAWPAGGPTDTVARIVAQKAGAILGESVIVDNRPGASGLIGTASVLTAPVDGNTVLMAVFQDVTRPAMGIKQNFSLLENFEPISKLYDLPFLITVNKSVLPVTNLQQLLAYARVNKLQYASSSIGSMGHLSFELIGQMSGTTAQHISYKGATQAMQDVIGGQVPMMYGDIVTALPQIRAGKLQAIAIGTASRIAALPDVPTVAESGFPGFLGVAWGGVVAPAGLSAPVKARLLDGFGKAMAAPDVLAKIRSAGVEPAPSRNPQEFESFMREESRKWTDLIKSRGIRSK